MSTAAGWLAEPVKIWRAACTGCGEVAPEGTQLDVARWSSTHRCTHRLTATHQGDDER